jgi:hypothetical protein
MTDLTINKLKRLIGGKNINPVHYDFKKNSTG